MEANILHDAVTLLEKANANLEPELMTAEAARALLAEYARAEKLAAFGKAVLARKIDDTTEIARDGDLHRQGQTDCRDRQGP
jgi:hypothetical protein